MVPISGFWLFLPQALIIITANQKRRNLNMRIKKESLLYVGQSDYDYVDSYQFLLADKGDKINITQIGECFISPGPQWVEGLLALRNKIVSVFKLKTGISQKEDNHLWEIGAQAGIFKVFDKTSTEIILGGDDQHLDFRVSLLIEQDKQYKKVTVTTVVKYHNRLGKCYFFFVKPIHKMIVPMTLKPKFKQLESKVNI